MRKEEPPCRKVKEEQQCNGLRSLAGCLTLRKVGRHGHKYEGTTGGIKRACFGGN